MNVFYKNISLWRGIKVIGIELPDSLKAYFAGSRFGISCVSEFDLGQCHGLNYRRWRIPAFRFWWLSYSILPFGYSNSAERSINSHYWICLRTLVEKVCPFCKCVTRTLASGTFSSRSISKNLSRKYLATQYWFWATGRTLGGLSPTLRSAMGWNDHLLLHPWLLAFMEHN